MAFLTNQPVMATGHGSSFGTDERLRAAWALGLLTQADPHPHIAQLVGEEICTVAPRIVVVCQRRTLTRGWRLPRNRSMRRCWLMWWPPSGATEAAIG